MILTKIILLILIWIILSVIIMEHAEEIFKILSDMLMFFIRSISRGFIILFATICSVLIGMVLAIMFIFSLPILFITQHFIIKKDKENVD